MSAALREAEAEFRKIWPHGPECAHAYAAAGFKFLAKAQEEMDHLKADAERAKADRNRIAMEVRKEWSEKLENCIRIHERAARAVMAERDEALAGVSPKHYDDWCDEDGTVLWWDTSFTGGEIAEPPEYVGSPGCSDWVYEDSELKHLLWAPLPKLARGKP